MIAIRRALANTILNHLNSEYPNEGCGLLAGRGGEVLAAHPVKNIEASSVSYLMDSREEFSAFKAMREEGLEFLGIYHSHPASEAYPSPKDQALAFYDQVFYLIVSLAGPGEPCCRAFWLRDGKIQEDKIEWRE